MKQICVVALLLTNIFLWGYGQAEESTEIQIGKTRLRIPSQYLLPKLPASMIPRQGMDRGLGVTLKIPYSDLKLSSHAQPDPQAPLMVFLSTPGEYLQRYGVAMDAYKAWHGKALYAKRIVEQDSNTGWYIVASKAAYPMFWHLFRKAPDGTTEPGESWIASCYQASAGRASCHNRLLAYDLESKLTLPEKALIRFSEIKSGYQRLLQSWITSAYLSATPSASLDAR
ncbi:MAG: hypothetical protein P8163_21080 [Candidatus Thiodiazotropha sp.]